MSTSRRSSSWSACRSTSCCAGAPESSVHDGLRCRGAMGDREARTQAALVCGHTGVAEDAASRRPARPDGTSVIVNRALREPEVGVEPTASYLQERCSTTELLRRGLMVAALQA